MNAHLKRRGLTVLVALTLAVVALAGNQGDAVASPLLARATAVVPTFGHVFVIVGENKSVAQLSANPAQDPYILNTFKPQSAWFTGYNSVTTGSLADYIALTSGQYAPCQTKGPCGLFDVPSIFSQLGDGAWNDWNESMPSNCHPQSTGSLTTLNFYKNGHNPALWYANLYSACQTYDVATGTTGPNDMTYFNNALAAGAVPKYNFIAPNGCDSGYQWCTVNGVRSTGVKGFNDFLAREIPLIEASPAYGTDGVIIVTFDEGHLGTSTMLAVVGAQVVPGTYSGYYDHYSTLATVQAGLGQMCLANACTARTLPIFAAQVR